MIRSTGMHTADIDSDLLTIEFGHSSLGLVLVAVSTKGIRAVQLGDDADELRAELGDRFPASRVQNTEQTATADKVVAMIEAGDSDIDADLDIRGTDFQRSVWTALRAVPPGSTISYTELARIVGRPAAVRAVAHACAANPLAVIIPCHRAVRSDGGLAGYRWGVERKQSLLEREALALV